MLKSVTAWVQAHPNTRMDSLAFMACMFDLSISTVEETMFRACWNMATIPGQAGAATEAIREVAEKPAVVVIAWPDRNSHVVEFKRCLGVSLRMANAVRHDLGRMLSRRFF